MSSDERVGALGFARFRVCLAKILKSSLSSLKAAIWSSNRVFDRQVRNLAPTRRLQALPPIGSVWVYRGQTKISRCASGSMKSLGSKYLWRFGNDALQLLSLLVNAFKPLLDGFDDSDTGVSRPA